MKKLQIDEGNAKKLYLTASKEFKQMLIDTFGEPFFNEKITDKINTLEDVFDLLDINKEDIIVYPNANTKFKKYINACAIIPYIVKVYNEGYILDWDNSSEIKYLPYYQKVGSRWVFGRYLFWGSGTYGSASHHYRNFEHLKDACRKFNDIYVDFYSFNNG